jgi:hypothetical protein
VSSRPRNRQHVPSRRHRSALQLGDLPAITHGRLPWYEAACRAVAKARTVDEAKRIRDVHEAMRVYARQAVNPELELQAIEIRERAERQLGRLINQQKRSVGLNRGAAGSRVTGGKREPVKDARPTLKDAGITKKLSSSAQKLAALPDEKVLGMQAWRRERVTRDSARITTNLLREYERAGYVAERERTDQANIGRVTALSLPDRTRILHASMEELLPKLSDVDAIISDLPYGHEYVRLYGELARLAKAALKPDGVLVVMTSVGLIATVLAAMTPHLDRGLRYGRRRPTLRGTNGSRRTPAPGDDGVDPSEPLKDEAR